jgi:3-methyladenine DNA glycosylase AlkD
LKLIDPETVAEAFDQEMRNLQDKKDPGRRVIRQKYTKILRKSLPKIVLETALVLIHKYGYRGPAYALVRHHQAAFQSLREKDLERLGKGINSWWSVDSFARILTGPVWLKGQIQDEVITRWAQSEDLWWRRTALVCTVALNIRSKGGYGDTERTLDICRILVDDHEDMVVKAMSWALRALVAHDPNNVREFLEEHDAVLHARVKREVRNKLETGLKNPRRRTQ